jgi:hypothetical protein
MIKTAHGIVAAVTYAIFALVILIKNSLDSGDIRPSNFSIGTAMYTILNGLVLGRAIDCTAVDYGKLCKATGWILSIANVFFIALAIYSMFFKKENKILNDDGDGDEKNKAEGFYL